MKAMIFAAGLGTRLRPLTNTMPKALVRVGGEPILKRIMLKLKESGYSELVLNVHHFASQICTYLAENDNFGLNVEISEEKDEALETGGGIKYAERFLQTGRFLVHNVDILSDVDLNWFATQDDQTSLATLLLSDREADRYLLFDDDMILVGWTNVKTGEVKSPYSDFNPSMYHKYSFCGIHIISDEVFSLMEAWPNKFSIIDFYLSVAASRRIRGVVAESINLIDIGSPETLAAADKMISGQ